jgi:hypothetical protein
MSVTVLTTGSRLFRYNYRINDCQETVTPVSATREVFIRHFIEDFGKVPETGSIASISHDGDKAVVAAASVKQSRSLKR